MGNHMLIVLNPQLIDKAIEHFNSNGVTAKVCGTVINKNSYHLHSKGIQQDVIC